MNVAWGERRRAAAGPAGPPARVAPDASDRIVWHGWSASSVGLANAGTGGTCALAPAGRVAPLPGPFVSPCWGTTAQDAAGNDGGILLTADTQVGEASSGSLSLWWYAEDSAYTGLGDLPLVGKAYKPAPWGSPYLSAAIHSFADRSIVFAARETGAMAATFVNLFADPLAAGAWHHLGLTWNGSFWRAYVDGALVDSVAQAAAIDWGNHGAWYTVGYPYQWGTAYRSPFGVVGDIRVANVARDAAYFATVWATRRTS